MSEFESPIDKATHRKLGVALFNYVWTLLEKNSLSPAETDDLIHSAHASRQHWAEAGTTVNLTRGEWQISRVYAVLNRPEPALYHAHRCLAYALQAAKEGSELDDWDIPFAHESLSRAYAIAGNKQARNEHFAIAKELAEKIADKEDRDLLLSDLATIPEV